MSELNQRTRDLHSIKRNRVLRIAIPSVIAISLIVWGQNCSRTSMSTTDLSSMAGKLDATEDEIFDRMQNGDATTSELEYSQERYKDYLDEQVSEINSAGRGIGGGSRSIPVREVIAQLTQEISASVSALRNMIHEERFATNSPEVLKKYAELIDLLSRARDVNNFLILKSDIGGIRLDISGLRRDFNALQASLTEVRNVIIPALKVELTGKMDSMGKTLKDDVSAREAAIRKTLSETEAQLLATIKQKETALRDSLSGSQKSILDQMKAGQEEQRQLLNARFDALNGSMTAQNQELRAMLNQRFVDLNGKLSESESRVLRQLNAEYNAVMGQMSAADMALRQQLNNDYQKLTASMDAQKIALVNQILEGDAAVRSEFDKKMVSLKNELVMKLETADSRLQNQMSAVQALANSNLLQIRDIQDSIVTINTQIRASSSQLKQLSEKIANDISDINSQFAAIRTAGNKEYQEIVANWNCSEDMIGKSGFEFFGHTAFANLDISVGQACILSKEKVLYGICTERYPAFCGGCRGVKDPALCPAWQSMPGKDRLEILMNIRQEVAINYLNEQTRLHGEAIYGGPSCNAKCLNKVSDPATQSALASMCAPPSDKDGNPVCRQDEWKYCGLYGITYSLAVNDVNLANKIITVNDGLAAEIGKLKVDFQKEKVAVADKFGLVQSEINEKIDTLKKTTESRFLQVARSMAGLGSGSGDQVAVELGNRTAFLAQAAAESANARNILLREIAMAMGRGIDQAKVSINGIDEEIIKILSSGMAVSSFEIVTEIFKTLNPNQNAMPFYSLDLKAKIVDTGKCEPRFVKFTPFTNVLGRDAHELIAVAYLRAVLLGDRSAIPTNNAMFFNTVGVVKSSELQQNLVGRLLDYRTNPSEAVPASCLSEVNNWAKDILLMDPRFASSRTSLAQNMTLERMASLLVDDAKKVMSLLGSLQGLILGSSGADFPHASYRMMSIANLLANAAIKQRVYSLVTQEVENLISVQKELSVANGFQSEFNNALTMFRESLASFKAGQADLTSKLQAEIAARQAADGVQAEELAKTKDAMGYLAALAQTDPLASQALKDKVTSAAVVDQSIKDLIKNINQSGRNKTEEPFTPKLLAIRHVTKGNVACFGKEAGVGQMPSDSAFVGSWGISNTGGAPFFPGDSCAANFRLGSQYKDVVIYRSWGSAHKIAFRSTLTNATSVVDFRQPEQASPLRKVTGGGFNSGVFDAQVPGLLDPVVARGHAYGEGIVALTPIYVNPAGAETKGTEQTYTMTLYSPLVFDFNTRGVPKTLSSSESGVQFDITASGTKMNVGWVSGRQGALLALDLNGNGRIDDGGELFGEFTKVKSSGENAKNGYEALAQYDANQDGRIDEKDSVFSQLKLWFDDNSNGIVDARELKSLPEMQVTKVNLKYKAVPQGLQAQNGNKLLYTARFHGPKQCGVKGCKSYDIYFGTAWMEKIPSYLSRR